MSNRNVLIKVSSALTNLLDSTVVGPIGIVMPVRAGAAMAFELSIMDDHDLIVPLFNLRRALQNSKSEVVLSFKRPVAKKVLAKINAKLASYEG